MTSLLPSTSGMRPVTEPPAQLTGNTRSDPRSLSTTWEPLSQCQPPHKKPNPNPKGIELSNTKASGSPS